MFGSTGARAEPKPGKGTITVTRHCPVEMRARGNWSIDQFVVAKKLGGGYASTVHLAICKATGLQVAIKVYHRCKLSQLNNYQVQREIRIHSCLDHKNVLQLYAAFEDEVGIYLVTEYASRGDVFGELDRRGGSMTEADTVRQVLSPFLSALEYLHCLNIIHRDIKPENLLFTAAGVLKVADFGLSIDITQERPVTRVGTLDYMAPEVVVCPDKCHPSDHKEKTHLHYTYLVDAWAVGVLAYELTVGRAPFDAGHKRGTIDNILNAAPKFPAWISDSCRHFVGWSLIKDTAKRPGIQQLAEHPWIHMHAGARPSLAAQVNPGRAVSFHNLSMYVDPAVKAAAGEGHGARVKLPEAQVPCGPLPEGDEEDVFVSATGEAGAGGSGGGSQQQQQQQQAAMEGVVTQPSVSAAAPGQQQQQQAAAAGGAKAPLPQHTQQVTTESPFAAAASQAAPLPLAGSPGTLLGAAADKLRAFVHRCQSANDIDALRLFMMMQPPEPSNACFEPGGRFYSGPPATPASSAPAAAGTQQQPAAVAQQQAASAGAGKHGMSGHDSAASLGAFSSSSSCCSRAADLPSPHSTLPSQPRQLLGSPAFGQSTGAAAKPLQLVKLPPAAGMPRSDSCKSLQGLQAGSSGSGADAKCGSGGAKCDELQVALQCRAASTSPMATSPSAPKHAGASDSTSSCSSCDLGAAASGSDSVSSCQSWGFRQQQQQHLPHQPPQPPSPPCLGGKLQQPCAVFLAPEAGGGSSSSRQVRTATAGPKAGMTELEQLVSICRPGHAVPAGSMGLAGGAGKPMVVSLTADCRTPGAAVQQQQQQQQAAALVAAAGQHQLLVAGEDANSCFGFLKSPLSR